LNCFDLNEVIQNVINNDHIQPKGRPGRPGRSFLFKNEKALIPRGRLKENGVTAAGGG